jgi:hypothetical protein
MNNMTIIKLPDNALQNGNIENLRPNTNFM